LPVEKGIATPPEEHRRLAMTPFDGFVRQRNYF
jgi:hypothetical protein